LTHFTGPIEWFRWINRQGSVRRASGFVFVRCSSTGFNACSVSEVTFLGRRFELSRWRGGFSVVGN
jgi:hypothetical protein